MISPFIFVFLKHLNIKGNYFKSVLTDNAYDPDVSAKQFWIDKTIVKGELCLSFMDNGNGLDLETMHKMLRYNVFLQSS